MNQMIGILNRKQNILGAGNLLVTNFKFIAIQQPPKILQFFKNVFIIACTHFFNHALAPLLHQRQRLTKRMFLKQNGSITKKGYQLTIKMLINTTSAWSKKTRNIFKKKRCHKTKPIVQLKRPASIIFTRCFVINTRATKVGVVLWQG